VSSLRRFAGYAAAAAGLALVVWLAFTCGTADVATGCEVPEEDSREGRFLAEGHAEASFDFQYPCRMPNSQRLTNVAVVGAAGRQSVTLSWDGPFDLSIQQSQVAPLINADPAGASHIIIDNLFPGVRADLIEINDGSRRAQYRLLWSQRGIYYEVVAVGPPLQRRVIIDIARGLN
jgi:hypothetical protein